MTTRGVEPMHPELCIGDSVQVNVEMVFQEGLVVSFASSNGAIYRGALIQQHSQVSTLESNKELEHPSILSPSDSLANPLSYLHDHPYAQMDQYAKRLTKTVPSNVLLQWNTTPRPPTSADETELTTQLTSDIESNPMNTSNNNNSNSSNNNIESSIVSIPEDSAEYSVFDAVYPFFVPGVDRHAKLLATLKMKAGYEDKLALRVRRGRMRSQSPTPKHGLSPSRKVNPLTRLSTPHQSMVRDVESTARCSRSIASGKQSVSVGLKAKDVLVKDFSIPVEKLHVANDKT